MSILPALAVQFQALFPATAHGQRRSRWFILTLQAILVPITASRTSNPKFPGAVTVSGKLGDDVKHYQERELTTAIEAVTK